MSLIHISKVSALTILALSIAACSSGGNHTKISPNTPPLTDQSAAAQKIEANRLVLLDKAKKAGLSAAQATAYAESNKQATDKVAQTALETLVAEKAAADKAAADKAAADKAAADKAAADKAAADKAAADKAAADKAAADKAAAEKAEKERLQKIETNRLVLLDKAKKAGLSAAQATAYAEANKQATDKVAQTALETLVAEKAAADKAAADKAAAEKAEKERLQKIEANRLVLLDKAKKAGLSASQAAAYAEANKQATDKVAQTALETLVAEKAKEAILAEARAAKGISDTMYPVGAITALTQAASSSITNALTTESRIQTVVYNQPYSVVLGNYSGSIRYNNQSGAIFNDYRDATINIRGLKTEVNALPTLGSATYNGKAFNGTYKPGDGWERGSLIEGRLSYTVDFTDRTGSGSITGLGDNVELQQGAILGTGISAIAKQGYKNGNYLLGFYGKKAEEVAGKVVFDGKDTIGFGGTRGEISKK